jgi:23S rRNA (uracil1939-C5)-methyltransferase
VTRTVRLRIERLAPTGEGVAHEGGKVVFVEGSLPGEEVDAVVFEEKSRHLRAYTGEVREASLERRIADAHAEDCGGTDWAHVRLEAARRWKRELFLESMRRVGGIAAEELGELPIEPSGLEYRLRNQFHVGRLPGREPVAGFFARHSHRVVSLDGCEIVSADTRTKIRDALENGALPEGGRIETVETVEVGQSHRLVFRDGEGNEGGGEQAAVDILVGERPFRVSAASFFQVNRHRVAPFFDRVRDLASASGPRTALDAFSGVGYLSQALAEAGATVLAVESSSDSARNAESNRARLGSENSITPRRETVESFLRRGSPMVDLVLVDPPRQGLGSTAGALANLARDRFLYVSCEPPTLARDLRAIRSLGFEIGRAWLEDFFPLTHRVEAVVELVRR